MSGISTHVLDTSRGRPASGVSVSLERVNDRGPAQPIGRGETDGDGRLRLPGTAAAIEPGTYRLTFDTGRYFAADARPTFYPSVTVTFDVVAGEDHYHVPLLLGPFGYTTYRGS